MMLPKNDTEIEAEFGDKSRVHTSSNDDEDFDPLLSESDDDSSYDDKSMYREEPNGFVSCIVGFIARIQYYWLYQRTEFLLGVILFVSVTLAFTGIIERIEGYENRPYHKRPVLHDYSNIKSAMELKLGDIDHWCLDGGDDKCPFCNDPLEAMPLEIDGWKAYIKNGKQARKARDEGKKFDVIFLGDSITEARAGTIGGVKMDPLQKIKKVFDSQFSKENNGMYNGLALGCAGDTSPNLLWRITQNEVPKDLNPKIWWITIGMNDLMSTMCSEVVTVMGILRVVEELFITRPEAVIVINSILPKATSAGNILKGKFIQNKYWSSIQQINLNLKRFATKHNERVKFFDADNYFVEEARGKQFMRKELFLDRTHPNDEGHKIWAEAQVKFITKILAKTEEESLVEEQNKKMDENDIGDVIYYDDDLTFP